jgi:hypothetical protein
LATSFFDNGALVVPALCDARSALARFKLNAPLPAAIAELDPSATAKLTLARM